MYLKIIYSFRRM